MRPWLYTVARWLLLAVMRLLFRWEVSGRENVPSSGPVVVCANHRSYWDPPILGCALPRPVWFMAKEELFRIPLFGRLITALGAFPVRRGAADLAALRRALSLLREGRAVGVFPEGRRVFGDEVADGRAGAVLLAAATGAPIVPVAICGRPVPFRRLRVRIGAPVDVREWLPSRRPTARDLGTVANDVVMRRIRELLEEKPVAGARAG